MPKIDVTRFMEQSGMRKARFGGYEPDDVRAALQALCTEYEQRLGRAEAQARKAEQENAALQQHCQTLTAQNNRLSGQNAALAGSSSTYSRQKESLDAQVSALQERNHSLNDQVAVLRLKNGSLQKEKEKLQERADQAEAALRIKGRELDDARNALENGKEEIMQEARQKAEDIVANAHVRADQIKEDAQAEAQAMDVSARDQAKAQAQKLVDAAAAEANEIQNAHQLRLNNLRAEVREMEAQRAALIDYLGLMSRKLLNLQNEAIANDPAAEARAADNADRKLETELPELHTVPTPEAALDLSPETVARAVDELRAQAAAAGEEDEPEPLSQQSTAPQEVEKQEEAAAPAEPAAVQPEEETPENAAPEAETEEQPKTEETPEPEKTEDKPDHPTGDPNHQTGPALTEVPGAIFSSPIVRPADAPRPDDTPPSATPMAPVMPSFEEEDELDAPAMPLPPREKPQEPEAEEEAPAVPEEPQPETPEAAKQGQREKYLPPQRGVYKRVQERLSLLHGVALLLLSGIQRRQRDGSAGVILEHPHLDSVDEHGGDHGKEVFDALGRKSLDVLRLVGPRLAQTVDELLDLTRRDFVHIEVPKGCMDPLRHIGIAGLCALAQALFHILAHPLAGEGLKFDVAVRQRGAAALFIKENHLPVQLLLNLPLRHAWRRRPGLRLHHLLALRGIAHRGPDTV